MNKKLIFITILAMAAIAACKKSESDTTDPVISISSPTEGQMFSAGDSVSVVFTVTDADLHGYDYAIIDAGSSDTLYDNDAHTHASISFSQKFKLNTAATQFILSVNGEDHTGNTSNKIVHFHTM